MRAAPVLRWWSWGALTATMWLATPLAAQPTAWPSVPSLAAPPTEPPAASAPRAVDPSAELAAARATLARLEQLASAGSPLPLLDEQRSLASRLVVLLGAEIDAVAPPPPPSIPAIPAALSGAGPYRVSEVDTLHDLRDSLFAQQQSLQYTLRGLDTQLDALLATRRRADEALRLKHDQLARSRDEEARPRLMAEAEVARLQARVGAIEARRADRDRDHARARLAALGAQAEALDQTLQRVRERQTLDDADIETVAQAAVATRRSLAQASRVLEQQLAARQSAAERAGGGSDAARRELQAMRERLGLLANIDLLEAGREAAWRQRQSLLRAVDGAERAEAEAVLQRSAEQLGARQRAADEQLAQARLVLRLQRSRVDALPEGAPEAADERRAVDAMQLLVDTLEQAQQSFAVLRGLLVRTLDDAAALQAESAVPWHGRLWRGLQQAARALWQYELFSVSDTTRLDGRDVTVDYGVTVGKSVGVLVLFAIGWWLTARLSRAGVDLLVRRAGLSPALGKVLNRWLVSILLLGVVVVVLKLARIPLTVFAFLGGALAIGVGFGTQNIIKNLISGVIILLERKVRVGDVVTIDGVSGTVTSVDLRAATVRGFDGIEAIVPNSQLLENRVSNWSLGTSIVRRAVSVGLRYGQSARQASELMRSCADADTAVLAEPAPEVLFAEFGPDAQVLRLQYWTRLGGPRSAPTIDSDLRHAIAAAFAEAGLVIAFPQRDVHIDGAGPLQVHLIRDAKRATP